MIHKTKTSHRCRSFAHRTHSLGSANPVQKKTFIVFQNLRNSLVWANRLAKNEFFKLFTFIITNKDTVECEFANFSAALVRTVLLY